MRVLKLSFLVAALSVALAAPSFAQPFDGLRAAPSVAEGQTPPTGTQPPKPPATPPAAAQPAPKPTPPVPFPQDSKFAYIDVQAVASNSATGKAATARLDEFGKKKQ